VIGRVPSPPSNPSINSPHTPAKREHISPKNPRANIGNTSRRKIIVNSFISSLSAIHFVKGSSLDHPVVQLFATNTERIIHSLVWTSAVAI
jgi:hypothetical protein